MESAIQIASLVATVVALALSIIAIWLSLYFYRRSNELHNSLNGVITRIEASTKVTEVASKDMILPIVQTVQEVLRSSLPGHIESLRPTIMQRSAAGIDEALKGLPEEQRTKIREAVYAQIDSFLGTLKDQVSLEFSPTGAPGMTKAGATIPSTSKPIPGSISYDWVPFIRRIRDLQAGNRFLSVKHLRETVFKGEPDSQEALQIAIDRKMLSTYYQDNPKNPQFPTLACKLNSEHPLVREILQAVGSKTES
jgi:hypothetical protein